MEKEKPVNCAYCPHMKKDLRPYVARRFYCGKNNETRKYKTIYDINNVPEECPVWGESK